MEKIRYLCDKPETREEIYERFVELAGNEKSYLKRVGNKEEPYRFKTINQGPEIEVNLSSPQDLLSFPFFIEVSGRGEREKIKEGFCDLLDKMGLLGVI